MSFQIMWFVVFVAAKLIVSASGRILAEPNIFDEHRLLCSVRSSTVFLWSSSWAADKRSSCLSFLSLLFNQSSGGGGRARVWKRLCVDSSGVSPQSSTSIVKAICFTLETNCDYWAQLPESGSRRGHADEIMQRGDLLVSLQVCWIKTWSLSSLEELCEFRVEFVEVYVIFKLLLRRLENLLDSSFHHRVQV